MSPTVEEINAMIAALPEDQKEFVSDGYHSYKELYAHRVALFVALSNAERELSRIKLLPSRYDAWKSMKHFDDSMFE